MKFYITPFKDYSTIEHIKRQQHIIYLQYTHTHTYFPQFMRMKTSKHTTDDTSPARKSPRFKALFPIPRHLHTSHPTFGNLSSPRIASPCFHPFSKLGFADRRENLYVYKAAKKAEKVRRRASASQNPTFQPLSDPENP